MRRNLPTQTEYHQQSRRTGTLPCALVGLVRTSSYPIALQPLSRIHSIAVSLVALWTRRRETQQKVQICSSQLCRSGSGRHLQNSVVIRTPSEQQHLRTRCPRWTTNNSTTCMWWVSQCGNSKNLPDGLKKEPALWNFFEWWNSQA